MDKLLEILLSSKLLSLYKRVNLLLEIGVNINFAEKNIDNYTDEDFAYTLINFLEQTQQIEILCKLCQEIESIITIGNYQTQLQTIKKKLEIFNIIILNLSSNQELFYDAYKLSLLEHDISIRNDSYPIKSIENSHMNEIIENINKLDNYKLDNYKNNNFSLLEYFVSHLIVILNDHHIHKNDHHIHKVDEQLNKWVENYSTNELRTIINSKKKEIEIISTNTDINPCLLIAIDNGNNNNLIIKGWFIKDTNKYGIEDNNYSPINSNFPEELIKDLTWESLEHQFPQLLNFILDSIQSTKEIKNIQLFLPYKKYVISVDTFLIKREEEEYSFGAYYQINTRVLERIKPATNREEKDYKDRWIKKCKLVKEKLHQCKISDIFKHLEILQKTTKVLKNELREDGLAIKIICAIEDSKIEEVMKIVYFTGIPLALWVRQNINNSQLTEKNINHYQTDLDRIIDQASCLETLLKSVQEIRKEADEIRENSLIGNYLSFFWDDADLVPLKDDYNHTLSMP